MWQHRQRALFCDLSANRRRCGRPSSWKQEARLLSYLSYPYCTVAVKTRVNVRPMCWIAVLVDPVLIHVVGTRPVLARFLFHVLVESGFLQNGGLGGRLWGRAGADLDREVLVNSGLLHWDLLHGAVVLWRQIQLILVLWLLWFGFRWDLTQGKSITVWSCFTRCLVILNTTWMNINMRI